MVGQTFLPRNLSLRGLLVLLVLSLPKGAKSKGLPPALFWVGQGLACPERSRRAPAGPSCFQHPLCRDAEPCMPYRVAAKKARSGFFAGSSLKWMGMLSATFSTSGTCLLRTGKPTMTPSGLSSPLPADVVSQPCGAGVYPPRF